MKYIKQFENLVSPEIGDYVICIPRNMVENGEEFFNNTIGIIIGMTKEFCGVEYENIPTFISNYYCNWREKDGKQYRENIIWFNLNMIKYYGKSKEEVKLKNITNKYNL
jgi:hypothetical protein